MALAETLAPADSVTLDRVVCCYPRYEALLGAAVGHARRCIAISYPRDRWFVRIALAVENALHALRGCAFRVVLHPPREMEQIIRGRGFVLSVRRATWAWRADVYRRELASR